jgi:hypothetical protein
MAELQPEFYCELPRYQSLKRLRDYLTSKQYDGRADFFTGMKPGSSEQVPLRERKPCVIYPLPKNSVNQVVRFTFGESRFPTISVDEVDAENSIAGERLSKDDAESLEKFIGDFIEHCGLKPDARRMMRAGLAVGTTCVILSIKQGAIDVQFANAEDVMPVFADGSPLSEVVRIVWCYQYDSVKIDEQGRPQRQRYWFRQDIDDKAYVEFDRVEFNPGEQPQWRESRRVAHGFGFCPVVWVRNVIEEDSREIDGTSLYAGQFDSFDALNFALSQRHRGINSFGSPQAWETGVEEDDGPQATGRTGAPGYSGEDSPHGKLRASKRAVKIGPDTKWTFRNEKAKVGLLETTGKAFEAATLHVNDIRSRALEAMGVVLVNISDIMGRTQAGQMSAKYLELAYEPLLALVDEMRHTWWPHGLLPVISACLRIVAARNGEGIYIPGAKQISPLLNTFFVNAADGSKMWILPKLTPVWGDYFTAGPDEISAAVTTAIAAKDGRIVPEEDASKYVLHYFGREDTKEALAEIESDKQKAADAAIEQTAQEAAKLHAITAVPNANDGRPESPSGKKPKKAPRGGSGDAAPPDAP